MVAIQNILLILGTAIAAVIPRDAATVLTDLEKTNVDIGSLTSSIYKWDGSTTGASSIQKDESIVEGDFKSAITDTKAVGSVSDSDADAIIDYINNTLEPGINAAIRALNAKMALFSNQDLIGVIKADLKNLQSQTDEAVGLLISKTSSSQKAIAKEALSKIDVDFANGIAVFNKMTR